MTHENSPLELKLKDKSVLLIGAKFYYYNEEIIAKMKSFGADVTFFYERDISLKYGIAKTVFPKYAERIQDNHYKNILRKIKNNHYDYLLVIRGYKMEAWFIEGLKKQLPNIKTIMYQWDSIYNWECDYRYLIPHFDVTKTFDRKDALDLGIEYVPTFHTDDFKSLSVENTIYDLFFVGGFSHTRYRFAKRLKEYAEIHNLKLKMHLAISIKYYLKERLSGNTLDLRLLSLKKLSKQEYIKLFQQSNIIVDYTNPSQTGITMRTLDALGGGKKLLTSNAYIQQEPGYREDQVQILDVNNIRIKSEFLGHQTFPFQDYSIEKWLDAVFD